MAEKDIQKTNREFRTKFDISSFFTSEKGVPHMVHLTSFIAVTVGVIVIGFSLWGFIVIHEGWMALLQIGGGLLAAASGLEGYETRMETSRLNGSMNRSSSRSGSESGNSSTSGGETTENV